jgi:hypothetical protein
MIDRAVTRGPRGFERRLGTLAFPDTILWTGGQQAGVSRESLCAGTNHS